VSIPAKDFPLRAIGGNVLLRRLKEDHRVFLNETKNKGVLQLGEVVGLGSRWTQDAPWFPPIPQQDRARSERLEREQRALVGEAPGVTPWKPMIRTPDSLTRRKPPPQFSLGHKLALGDINIGDLVYYSTPRIYDHFEYEGDDIIIYPGCWLYGVVTDTYLADPTVRRTERVDV
jgi:hypothetical protein